VNVDMFVYIICRSICVCVRKLQYYRPMVRVTLGLIQVKIVSSIHLKR